MVVVIVVTVQQEMSSPNTPSDPTLSDEPEPKSTENENETAIECSALCGNNATGKLHIKVRIKARDAEATDMPLPLCDSCRERIDPDHQWIFVRFHFSSQIDRR